MRKDIGYTIKFHRKKENMTQKELANGIISISYLSKIENGFAQPPADIIELLLERLNIDLNFHEDTRKVEQLCKDWFIALFRKGVEQTHRLFRQIEEHHKYITDNNLLNLIEIHKLRYYLIHSQTEKAALQQEKLYKMAKDFSINEMYYWLKFSGNYYFNNAFYNQALNQYQEAEKYVKYSISLEEECDLHYMIALVASYVKKTYLIYKHANAALDYYQKNLDLKQAAQCHILLGITAVRIRDFDDALESFTLAEKIAKIIDNQSILATALQNIGNLHTLLNDSVTAIKYYQQSYELRSDVQKKIVPVYSLMKEYYKTNDLSSANYWIQQGLKMQEQLNASSYSLYAYEIEVYNHMINGGNHYKIVQLIENDIIPFINEREQQHQKIPFLEILANQYFDNKKYKLAATYYKQALEIKSNSY